MSSARSAAAVLCGLVLVGCTTAGYIADGATGGWVHYTRAQRDTEAAQKAYQAAVDECADVECMQVAKARYQAALAEIRARPSVSFTYADGAGASKVYSADECVGAIVNGECHGSILPNKAYHPTCHGQMINGQCTGPMF